METATGPLRRRTKKEGLKKLTFNADGDAQHVHNVIISSFSVLDSCGGYTLLRLKENSRKLVPN